MTTSINTACGGILSGRKSEADIRGGGVRRGGAFYDRLASVARVVEQAWGEVAVEWRIGMWEGILWRGVDVRGLRMRGSGRFLSPPRGCNILGTGTGGLHRRLWTVAPWGWEDGGG